MTLLADPLAPPVPRWRRVWGLPVGAHLAALGVILLLLVPVVGTASSFSADEGAAIVQARSLARGDGWIVEHPLPDVDPRGVNYPLENSEHGQRGFTPYAKHPLYALLLAGADMAGGVPAMVLLSLAGTLCAAGLAALLARRLDPGLARPTLWLVGLGSPLLFDGFLVIAHTVAAALAVGAVLLVLRAVERRSAWLAVAVGPVVAVAVLLRTEAVFLAGGLAVVAGLLGLADRRSRLSLWTAAGASVVAAGLARILEQRWTLSLVGAASGGSAPTAAVPGGGMAGRVHGFVLTWLTTGYTTTRLVDLALLLMLSAALAAAFVLRRGQAGSSLVVRLAGLAAAAAIVAVVSGPRHVVPGLLVTFPAFAAGLVLLDGRALSTLAARLAFGTFGLFAAAVAATQYASGGSGEWGGRYFALGLPLAVPVVLLALRSAGGRLDAGPRRFVAGALLACTAATACMAIGSLRDSRARNVEMNSAVRAALRSLPGTDRPVAVATSGSLARHAWPEFDDARWLRSDGDFPDLARRLRAAGVTRFVVLSRSSEDLVELGAGVEVVRSAEGTPAGRSWRVLVVQAT